MESRRDESGPNPHWFCDRGRVTMYRKEKVGHEPKKKSLLSKKEKRKKKREKKQQKKAGLI